MEIIERQPVVTINDIGDENKVTNCNHIADDSKMDLISRTDALSCFHDWIDSHGDVHTADEMPEYQQIEQLQSAQPEVLACGEGELIAQPEIIHCKDCNYYFYDVNFAKSWCNRMSGIFMVKPDSYCSFAVKRKENR